MNHIRKNISKTILISLTIIFSIFLIIYLYMYEELNSILIYIGLALITIKSILIKNLILLKTKAIALFLLSKLKLMLYIKGLTIIQFVLLGVKRFFIDHVLSKWIKEHITNHLKDPLKKFFHYLKILNWKYKIKRNLKILLPAALFTWVIYMTQSITSMAIYLQIKVIIIGFFKILWVIAMKIWAAIGYVFYNFIAETWLAPVLEIFALSFLLNLIEKLPIIGPPLHTFLSKIGNIFEKMFEKLKTMDNEVVHPKLHKYIGLPSKKIAQKIEKMVNESKIKNEELMMKEFINKIKMGHIDNYLSFKKNKIDYISDKDDLYNIINRKTKDNIDIVAYVSINDEGLIVKDENEKMDNGKQDKYTNDLFILEGLASSNTIGADYTKDNKDKISKYSFWILNTSKYDFKIYIKNSQADIVKANSIKLIKPTHKIDYDNSDIIVEDRKGERVAVKKLKDQKTKEDTKRSKTNKKIKKTSPKRG